MDAATVEQAWRLAEETLAGLGIETQIVEGIGEEQTGGTLRMLPAITEEGRLCLTELMVSPMGDALSLLSLFSTLLPHVERGWEELVAALPDWNLLCPIGAFGVYRDERLLYHKYSIPLPNAAGAENLSNTALLLAELVFNVLSQQWKAIAAIVNGNETD